MKSALKYKGYPVTIYSIELCHYGDNGDYEALPDRELNLDLNTMLKKPVLVSYKVNYFDNEVILFNRDEVGFTLFCDGRLIIEGLSPGTGEQAIEVAAEIIGYTK